MPMDRRDASLFLGAMATLALAPFARNSFAAMPEPLSAQPWAVWNDKDKPVSGGIYRVAAASYIGMMNPNRWPVSDWESMGLIHDKLFITDGSYRPMVAWLAESIQQETPTTVLLTLRPGVKFHDGTPFTAESIKYQVDWIRNGANGAWTVGWFPLLESIEVVGPQQLRWKFKLPWASFTGVMANVPGYALSDDALRRDAKKFELQPMGAGPYLVEEASPGNFLKLKRNPDWWFAKAIGRPAMPYFDGIHVSVIPDPGVRLANFRAGKIDALTLDKSQYRMMQNDTRANVHVQSVPTTTALRFNSAKGVCTDIRVRKALSHAIDRKALIAGTQQGLGRIASGLFPDDHWAHNANLKPVEYNPQLAKDLLAQAGFAKGLTINGFAGNTTASQTVAEAIKNMLRQVGVTWDVELLAPVAAVARLREGNFDLAGGGWTYLYDPDLACTGLYHPTGAFAAGRGIDPKVISLIEAARNEIVFEKRRTLYQAIERIVADDHQDLYLWWEQSAVAFQKYVRGYDADLHRKHKEVYARSHPLWFAEGKPGKVG